MLTDLHRKSLEEESGITPEIIEARGYKSVDPDSPELEAFGKSQRASGLLIPGWDVWGQRLPGQIRPDMPRVIRKGSKDVTLKYESPQGSRAYLDVHPSIRDRVRKSNEVLVITEGCKKADAAIANGMLCTALLGVWGWRGKQNGNATAAIPDFDAIPLRGRIVLLAFDSDVVEKREVVTALKRLTAYLERYGADVRVLTWKGAKIGDRS